MRLLSHQLGKSLDEANLTLTFANYSLAVSIDRKHIYICCLKTTVLFESPGQFRSGFYSSVALENPRKPRNVLTHQKDAAIEHDWLADAAHGKQGRIPTLWLRKRLTATLKFDLVPYLGVLSRPPKCRLDLTVDSFTVSSEDIVCKQKFSFQYSVHRNVHTIPSKKRGKTALMYIPGIVIKSCDPI